MSVSTRALRNSSATPTPPLKEKPSLSCPLYMECEEEPLSLAQKSFSKDRKSKFLAQMSQLEKLAKSGGRFSNLSDSSVAIRVTETENVSSSAPPPPVFSNNPVTSGPPQAPPPAPAGPPGPGQAGYRLLMDPRTGRILGTINSAGQHVPAGSSARPLPGGVIRPNFTPQQPPPIKPRNAGSFVRQPQIVDLTRTAEKSKNMIPSLLVTPKPSKTLPATTLSSRRTELDSKVKTLLIHSPAKFTEWLIQQGLVPTNQFDLDPTSGARIKLKLGMYSDIKKFPFSGGYVWINENQPSKIVSVYTGSIFQATSHAPTVVLKLIYHWACQTNNQNVVQWVKVDNNVINLYYKLFRSVCTVAVNEDILNFGGLSKAVQLGVISLGTTSGEGSKREVRVEVLGILEVETGRIRLRATEPIHNVSQSERFARIFEPLPNWVLKSSCIVTDYSVDKERLVKLGYTSIYQCNVNAARSESSNTLIMDYLKRTVPKMFQNNLSYLSTGQIQQFLDELLFRETYNYPLACFDKLIQKIAHITSSFSIGNDSVIQRLKKVQDNPFMEIKNTQNVPTGIDALPPSIRTVDPPIKNTAIAPKRTVDFTADIDRQIAKKIKVSNQLVDLESYFYATLPGDMQILLSEFKADMAFKCHLCRKVYMNNIEFMKHLCLHIESDRSNAVDLADLCQCKYCYRDFDTPYKMQAHLEVHHLKKGCEFVCRICDEGFKVKNHLIHHMTKVHVRSELPYLCNVCGFRSSSHRDLIDHFQEAHDRTDKLQCPRCLKTYSLFGDRGYNSTVASAFVSHLQAHQDKKAFSCKSCCLSFLQNDYLKNHVIRDHASFKGFENLEVYQYVGNEEPIQMPKPDERLARTAARKSGLLKSQPQMAFAAQNLEDMVMYNVDKEDCGECNKRITNPGHYAAYLCCTKCRYSTCCSKAISVHVNMFHGNSKPIYTLGAPCILDLDVFCVCGFKTSSGNKMAKHLAKNSCKTAYPSREISKGAIRASASFAPLISIDGDEAHKDPSVAMAEAYRKNAQNQSEEKKNKEDEGPLAFLGLQRKSVDGEDSKSSSVDDEKSEKKLSDESNNELPIEEDSEVKPNEEPSLSAEEPDIGLNEEENNVESQGEKEMLTNPSSEKSPVRDIENMEIDDPQPSESVLENEECEAKSPVDKSTLEPKNAGSKSPEDQSELSAMDLD